MRRVTPRRRMKAAVRMAAAMISGMSNEGSERAVAAMAFMGWTGMGTP